MAFYGYRGKMTAEERRAAARARVKAWKEANGWSLRQQRKRRYARMKAAKQAAVRGVQIELEVREKREAREVQETFLEHPALTEGDPETVREHARVVARRRGVGVPEGLMEPEWEEVRRHEVRVEERQGSAEDIGTVRERFEALKRRKDLAVKEVGASGVEVDLVL